MYVVERPNNAKWIQMGIIMANGIHVFSPNHGVDGANPWGLQMVVPNHANMIMFRREPVWRVPPLMFPTPTGSPHQKLHNVAFGALGHLRVLRVANLMAFLCA